MTPGWPWLESGTSTATLTTVGGPSATGASEGAAPPAQPPSSRAPVNATAALHATAARRRNIPTLSTVCPPART
jgi:hypothetical protein